MGAASKECISHAKHFPSAQVKSLAIATSEAHKVAFRRADLAHEQNAWPRHAQMHTVPALNPVFGHRVNKSSRNIVAQCSQTKQLGAAGSRHVSSQLLSQPHAQVSRLENIPMKRFYRS
jgi:hypothetical protein